MKKDFDNWNILKYTFILTLSLGLLLPPIAYAASPIGCHDAVKADNLASGWALDPDTPNQPLTVSLYLDGTLTTGQLIGTTTANHLRPDVNQATGYSGDHGFEFKLPDTLSGTHEIRAYAADSSTGLPMELCGDPQTATLYTWNDASRIVGMDYEAWFPGIPGGQQFWNPRWGTPLLGTYNSNDPAIIDRHAEWISAAGADFILIDWSENLTNDVLGHPAVGQTIEANTDAVFAEYEHLAQTGKPHPKISILMGVQNEPGVVGQQIIDSGALQHEANAIHDRYVTKYPDLFFYFHGKPFISIYMGTPAFTTVVPNWNDMRFTVRWMTGHLESQPYLYGNDPSTNVFWGWISRDPVPSNLYGKAESVTITSAYPGDISGWLDTAGKYPARGRSGVNGQSTFGAQWNKALSYNPQIIMLNQWNEFASAVNGTGDQYTVEFSNDLEPTSELGCTPLSAVQSAIAAWKGVSLPAINCKILSTTPPPAPAPPPQPTPISIPVGSSGGGGGSLITAPVSSTSTPIIESLKAQVAQLLALLTKLKAGNAPAQVTSNNISCLTLTRTLKLGSTGSDVVELQKFLAANAGYTGKIGGTVGPLTVSAIQRWQVAHGIVSSGTPETTGYGAVGPKTRATLARCDS